MMIIIREENSDSIDNDHCGDDDGVGYCDDHGNDYAEEYNHNGDNDHDDGAKDGIIIRKATMLLSY